MKNISDEKKQKIGIILITGWLLISDSTINIFKFMYGYLPDWLIYIYHLLTYLVLAYLIYLERNHLSEYHIDKVVLLTFLFSGFFWWFTLQESYLTICILAPVFIIVAISIYLSVYRKSKTCLSANINGKPIIIGIFTGLGLSFLYNLFPVLLKPSYLDISELPDLISILIKTGSLLFYYLSHGTVYEEILYRGFLWGYLRKFGWQEKKILIVQALLFWLAHISGYNLPYYMVFVPVSGLIFGLLVWRLRSLSSSIFAHAIVNSFWNLMFVFILVLFGK